MHLASRSLTGLTDSKQKLYQMKLFLQKTANCTRSAASYAAALPAPRAAARAWRRAAGLAANGSAAKHLLPRSTSAAELLAEAVVALRKKRNREEISEAELTDAVRDLERVFAKSPS